MGAVERGQDRSVHGGRGGSVQPDVSVDPECGPRVWKQSVIPLPDGGGGASFQPDMSVEPLCGTIVGNQSAILDGILLRGPSVALPYPWVCDWRFRSGNLFLGWDLDSSGDRLWPA